MLAGERLRGIVCRKERLDAQFLGSDVGGCPHRGEHGEEAEDQLILSELHREEWQGTGCSPRFERGRVARPA